MVYIHYEIHIWPDKEFETIHKPLKIILNGQLLDERPIISLTNRAFQFGDGIFETIIFKEGCIRFFNDHYERLISGLSALHLSEDSIKSDELKLQVSTLCELNGLDTARIKIMVWRQTSNLPGYQSDSKAVDYAITTCPTSGPRVQIVSSLKLSDKVKLNQTMTSEYKTLSSLPYVLAAMERRDRNVGDLVLTDYTGHVSECCSSNLFWITDEKIFTPTLSTGCVNGIMRRQLLKEFDVTEATITYDELTQQQLVFSTNVAQLSLFKSIDEFTLNTEHSLLESIKQLWEL